MRPEAPRSRVDKLGVKPGHRVLLIGIDAAELAAELAARDASVTRRAPSGGADVIVYAADRAGDLARLPWLRERIVTDGAIWVVRPKGKHAKEITEQDVFAAAKAAGLVDTKVVAFDDTRTAHRLVIPLAQRPTHRH